VQAQLAAYLATQVELPGGLAEPAEGTTGRPASQAAGAPPWKGAPQDAATQSMLLATELQDAPPAAMRQAVMPTHISGMC
jgi:hypothetical protein